MENLRIIRNRTTEKGLGPSSTKKLLKKLMNDVVTWQDFVSDKFFEDTPLNVFTAEMELNECLQENGEVLALDWFRSLRVVPHIDHLDILYGGSGWGIDCLYEHNETLLTFSHRLVDDPERGIYFVIEPNVKPCCSFRECRT